MRRIIRPLVLVGGGGHCKSVIEAAESAGYSILGVLDMPENIGKEILSTKVIGTDDDIPKYVDKAEFIITVGFITNPATRIKLYNRIKEVGGKLATIIASTAYVSKYATISEGTVIMHHAFVNARAKVGKNVIINSFACIEHDSTIGDHCHISTGAIVNGGCLVGENVFIGSQSVLANNAVVGNDIIISAGSFVKNSITKQGLYFGNPAHIHT
ncbi:MAG: acetyltransferase [Prevotella sp.]|nr:acetyltransferase [Prevotella sp.]